MNANVESKMARLEEKVGNIKETLDDVVKEKLPHLEGKLDSLAKVVYIGIGLAMAIQVFIGVIERFL